MSDQTVIALLGIFGSITAGFFKLINDQNKASQKQNEAMQRQNEVHAKIAEGLTGLTKASERGAKATERAALEAEKRNGHLAEITVQQADRIMTSLEHITEQRVDKQVVNKQVKK